MSLNPKFWFWLSLGLAFWCGHDAITYYHIGNEQKMWFAAIVCGINSFSCYMNWRLL